MSNKTNINSGGYYMKKYTTDELEELLKITIQTIKKKDQRKCFLILEKYLKILQEILNGSVNIEKIISKKELCLSDNQIESIIIDNELTIPSLVGKDNRCLNVNTESKFKGEYIINYMLFEGLIEKIDLNDYLDNI